MSHETRSPSATKTTAFLSQSVVDLPRGLSLLTAPSEIDLFRDAVPDGVSLYGLLSVDRSGIVIVDEHGRKFALRSPPTLCLGAVAGSQAGLRHLERLCADLADLGSLHAITPVLVEEGADALRLLLASSLVERFREQSAMVARLAREQAELRALHENMQNAFAQLEGFVASSGLQPVRHFFENAPGSLAPIGGAGVAAISQVLPLDSSGLVAMELLLSDEGPLSGFVVKLSTLEDSLEHALWDFRGASVEGGWLLLELPKAIVALPKTPVLEVVASDAKLGAPMVCLGAPQPHSAYRARAIGASRQPIASLALRVWKGIGGVRPPAFRAINPPPAKGPRSFETLPPLALLRQIRWVEGPWRPDFEAFQHRPEIRGFLLHPGPYGWASIAVWDELNLAEPSRLSANVAVESAEAAPIEFCMAFSTLPQADIRDFLSEQEGEAEYPNISFTGWRRVYHGDPVILSIILTRPRGSLYFATRMADKAPEWFAWATFRELRQTFLGHEAVSEAVVAAPAIDATLTLTSKPPVEAPPSEIPARRIDAQPVEEDTERLETDLASPNDRIAQWLTAAREAGVDPVARSVQCPPPNTGISLRRLPDIRIGPKFLFESNIFVVGSGGSGVEVAVVVSDLGSAEVLGMVTNVRSSSLPPRIAFSGWKAVSSTVEPSRLSLKTLESAPTRVGVYLLSRLAKDMPRRGRVQVAFEDIAMSDWRIPENDA